MQIGIVAALPGELAPLVKGWEQLGLGNSPKSRSSKSRVLKGRLALPGEASATVYATAAGMGAAAATIAFADLLAAAGTLDAVISWGWAGAITCGVKPPEFYQLHEVIDSRTGERFATAAPADSPALRLATLRLVTLDHVARASEKRPLAERYQAILVDMEAATVARVARAHGIPFLCIKAVSDGYTDVLPDFNRFLNPQGQLRLAVFVAYAAAHPRYWAPLVRLGANSRAAARGMAAYLTACLARDGTGELPACLAAAGLLSSKS
jgi:adenosylhomocysteine nucleosidase